MSVDDALDCKPQGDYVTKNRVEKFSDQLEEGEKAHYILALNWVKLDNEKKNPTRQSLALITDQNIHILVRALAGQNEFITVPLGGVENVELKTGITSKKLIIRNERKEVVLKATQPGKAECKEASQFIKNIIRGAKKTSQIGEKDNEEDENGNEEIDYLMKAKGANGQLKLYKDKVVITREGFTHKIVHGFKGAKEIPLNQITGIQFKEPGRITAGYIQFGQSGYSESSGGLQAAAKDENSITFGKKYSEKFKDIKEKLMNSELRILPDLLQTLQ